MITDGDYYDFWSEIQAKCRLLDLFADNNNEWIGELLKIHQ